MAQRSRKTLQIRYFLLSSLGKNKMLQFLSPPTQKHTQTISNINQKQPSQHQKSKKKSHFKKPQQIKQQGPRIKKEYLKCSKKIKWNSCQCLTSYTTMHSLLCSILTWTTHSIALASGTHVTSRAPSSTTTRHSVVIDFVGISLSAWVSAWIELSGVKEFDSSSESQKLENLWINFQNTKQIKCVLWQIMWV